MEKKIIFSTSPSGFEGSREGECVEGLQCLAHSGYLTKASFSSLIIELIKSYFVAKSPSTNEDTCTLFKLRKQDMPGAANSSVLLLCHLPCSLTCLLIRAPP